MRQSINIIPVDKDEIEDCPKCNSSTYIKTRKRLSIEYWCTTCGLFNYAISSCCNKPDPELIIYTNSNDAIAYREQCMNCGKLLPTKAKSQKGIDSYKLKNYNEYKANERLEAITELYNFYKDLKKNNRFFVYEKHYLQYLKSDEWKAKRLEVLKRDNSKCQICSSSEQLDIHHKTYENFRNENLDDLQTVCRKCHKELHGLK